MPPVGTPSPVSPLSPLSPFAPCAPSSICAVVVPFLSVTVRVVVVPDFDVVAVGTVAFVINPESLTKSLVLVGIIVSDGRAPTSYAVYEGFVDAFAQLETVGSVSS